MIYPQKLKSGDKVAIIAPAKSFSLLSDSLKNIANKRFEDLGLELVFGKHINESNESNSSTIESRLKDLHSAFKDNTIKGILTVIGGFNTNQLLKQIDWNLIKNNPKVFCGFSDITALNNAILAKTGLVTYSGPHYSTFGQELHFEYTLDHFIKQVITNQDQIIQPSKEWSDDAWYINQQDRNLITNPGVKVINKGKAKGRIVGGNISTFSLLNGTEYMPIFDETILFLEDDEESYSADFDRQLQSIIHQPWFNSVKGIVIGRFQKASEYKLEDIIRIFSNKNELEQIPVGYGIDFGHTDPKITIPIGGLCEVDFSEGTSQIRFLKGN